MSGQRFPLRRCAAVMFFLLGAGAAAAPALAQQIEAAESLPDLDLPRVTERGELVDDLRALRVKARQPGGVPVIVGLRMKTRPDGELAVDGRTLQRARIEAMQEGVLGELSSGRPGNVKRFRYIPHLAVTVGPAELDTLLASERVTSLGEDVAAEPHLSQSTPLVNANKGWAAGFSGTGWAVAVLDTGVQNNHPFLAGRVVHEACFSTTNAGLAVQSLCPNGSDQQIGTGAAAPCASGCSHGTHVAGIAAGAGSAYSGVAPGASVIAIQVFSRFNSEQQCGAGNAPCVKSFTSDWMGALEYLYSIRGQYQIAAANMSLGGGQYFGYCDNLSDSVAPKQAIDNLRAAGIATVISSGNSGYVDSLGSPSCISSAVSVGSTWDAAGFENYGWNSWNGGPTSVDEVAAYSNSASFLDLLAPGSAIQSSIPGGGFGSKDGTSMAAPHVAGCWALLKQAKPAATVAEVEQALVATGVPVQDWRNSLTKPRIDCKAAMDRLTGTTAVASAADLQISAIGVTPSSLPAGGEISISASVRNAGTANSAATTLRYRRSTDATINAADSALACTAPVGALTPGAFASAPLCQVTAPAGAGTYYYGVCVDAVAGESDTANNCSHGQVVTVTASGLPELGVTSVSGDGQATAGGTLAVAATVANHGAATSGAHRIAFYLSPNTTITPDDIYFGYCDVGSLSPGANFTCSGGVGLPTQATPGVYYIGAIVDADGQVAESNEQNNALAASATTTIIGSSPVSSLGDGLDNTSLSWSTGGDAAWFRQTGVSYYGGDSVRAGAVAAGGVTYLQTTVAGPGTFSFHWKVSSEADYDALVLLLDNELVDYISGETDWAQVSLAIPAGSHTLTWAYIKDETVSGGLDTGWVDKAVYSTGGTGLFVDKAGPGTGRVTSAPAGIDCGADCSEAYASGTSVTLTARPDYGYVFAGWSGACAGTGPTCTVAMSAARTVTASFSRPDDAFPGTPLATGWSLHPAESDAPWMATTDSAHAGLRSLRSAVTGDGGVSALSYTGNFSAGYVSFAAKVSSEADYDYLVFLIDDELVDYGSGEIDWSQLSYPISAGNHTLTWAYVKDESWEDGQDAAWIDAVSLPLAVATGVLGTPVSGSTVSGVGVISGYHCSSKNIEVRIDGVSLGKAGAGTTLLGTLPVCGHADTGYSLLYNFNNLANGPHTLSAYADGVQFASHSFTSFRSGGVPWLAGASKTATLADFPQAGQSATLEWVQSYQNFLITGIGGASAQAGPVAGVAAAANVGVLGTPVAGGTVSGVGVISGYHCSSKDIDVYIDGAYIGKAGAGTTLLGTQAVCGRTDTGYSLLYNFNNLANGQHLVEVYADGGFFDSHAFTSFQSGGTAWLAGVSRTTTVPGFPQAGQTATLQWQQSYQNFLVTGIAGQ
jgi:uncharacterized repeat protein (TIGR02543 family)